MTEYCPIPYHHACVARQLSRGWASSTGYHEMAFGVGFLFGFLLFLGKGTELLIFLSCLGAATSSKHVSIFFCRPSCLELNLVGSGLFLYPRVSVAYPHTTVLLHLRFCVSLQ